MGALRGQTIGFIGLGLMGKGMSRNLHKAGATLFAHNRSRPAMDELAAEGMQPCASARELATRVGGGIIVICVTDTPSCEAVLSGENGVAAGLKRGALVIDMGTTAVMATRRFAATIRDGGADYVDAPVSGGQVGANEGTLSIMAGGSDAGFARALPLFQAMGKNITHVGEVGAGQIAKTANQMIVALTLDAVAEAFTLARAAGVDPAKVRQALMGGFAASRILELHGQRMVEGKFAPGGRAVVQRKDVWQARELADQVGIDLPTLKNNLQLWDKLIAQGDGDLDHSAIIRIYGK